MDRYKALENIENNGTEVLNTCICKVDLSANDIITSAKEGLMVKALSEFYSPELSKQNVKTLKNNIEHVFGDEAYEHIGNIQRTDSDIEAYTRLKVDMNMTLLMVPKIIEKFLEHGLQGYKHDLYIEDFVKQFQKFEELDLSPEQNKIYDSFKNARLKYDNKPEYEVANMEIRKMVDDTKIDLVDIDVLRACAYKTIQIIVAQIGSTYVSTKEYVISDIHKDVTPGDVYELEYIYATFIVNLVNIFKILQKVVRG